MEYSCPRFTDTIIEYILALWKRGCLEARHVESANLYLRALSRFNDNTGRKRAVCPSTGDNCTGCPSFYFYFLRAHCRFRDVFVFLVEGCMRARRVAGTMQGHLSNALVLGVGCDSTGKMTRTSCLSLSLSPLHSFVELHAEWKSKRRSQNANMDERMTTLPGVFPVGCELESESRAPAVDDGLHAVDEALSKQESVASRVPPSWVVARRVRRP